MKLFRQYIPFLLVFAIGLLFSFTLFLVIRDWERRLAEGEFRVIAQEHIESVERGMRDGLNAVSTLRDFLGTSWPVSRQQFHDFITPTIKRYPYVQAFEWIPRLNNNQRPAYEAKARIDYPAFHFIDRATDGKLGPSADAEEFFPVYYVEPYQGNEAVLGYTGMSSHAVNKGRSAAILRARDTGELSSTGRVRIIQETSPNRYGLLVFAPVYQRGSRVDTVENRHANLIGLAEGVLRVGKLVDAALAKTDMRGIEILLLDQSAPPGERFLYFSAADSNPSVSEKELEIVSPSLQYSKTFEAAGRRWSVIAVPSSGFYPTTGAWVGSGFLLGGVLFSLLLATYIQTLVGRSARVRKLVNLRSGEVAASNARLAEEVSKYQQIETALRESESEVRTIADALPAFIAYVDAGLHYRFLNKLHEVRFNRPCAEMIGLTLSEVMSAEDCQTIAPYIEGVLKGEEQHYFRSAKFADGSTHHIDVSYIPDFSTDGKVVGYYAFSRDVTDLKQVETELKVRTQQQAAVAELGKYALVGTDLQRLFEEAVSLVARTLDVEYSAIIELVPGAENLFMRATYGRSATDVNLPGLPVSNQSHSGYTLRVNQPVIIESFEKEKRFVFSSVLRDLGVTSGISVIIPGRGERAFGLLDAHSKAERNFSQYDIYFLQALANVLADAIVRKQAEEILFDEKEWAQVTLESIGDAVITTDADGLITYMNRVAEGLTGWTYDSAMGRDISEVFSVIDEVSREGVAENSVMRCLRDGEVTGLSSHTLLTRYDGKEYAIDDSAAPIRDRSNRVIGAVLVFHDVTQQRSLARQLSHQATHDSLTNLINRLEFERRLVRVMASANQAGTEHALCYLDLDQFKLVNDTSGHIAGDELLRQLASLLPEKLRKRDTLARLGGDEFGVLLEHCPLDQALRIANDLRQVIREFRFVWEDKSFSIGVSIGLVMINEHSESMSAVLSAADAACYMAKERGRNRVHIYQADDSDLSLRHGEMQWISRIHKAFDENRFCLFYQPIVPLHPMGQEPAHYEILIRMLDERGGLIPPGAFIPAAERYSMMPTIDRWVIQNTLAWYARKRVAVPDFDAMFSINLSGTSMTDDSLLAFVNDRLEHHNIPPATLCFEITETAAITTLTQANVFIKELKRLGCHFALDDFGSGMSSFTYLKNLPVDFLKIDGNFVKDIVDDPIDWAMVEAINRIGQVMGIRTIAEYAENDKIIERLRELGVDYAQGFGIALPQPLEDL